MYSVALNDISTDMYEAKTHQTKHDVRLYLFLSQTLHLHWCIRCECVTLLTSVKSNPYLL